MCQTNCTDRPLLHSSPWLIVLSTFRLTVCPYPRAKSRVHIFHCARRIKETARIDHGVKGSRTDAHHSEKLTLICGLSFTCTRLKSADAVPVSCLGDIQANTSFSFPAIGFECVRKLKKVDLLWFLYSICVLFPFL